MSVKATLAAAATAAALGLAACGSAGHPTTAARASPSTTSASATTSTATTVPRTGLARFLLTSGEETGFPPDLADGGTFSTLKGWVSFTQLTATEERVLASEGFVAAAQETVGGAGNDGASFVEEFRSAAGARQEAANDADQAKQGAVGGAVAFFSVPGLPSSHGVLVDDGGGIGTDIYWTEGRCTLWLGNEASAPLKFQVEDGAKAIFRRTDGTCP